MEKEIRRIYTDITTLCDFKEVFDDFMQSEDEAKAGNDIHFVLGDKVVRIINIRLEEGHVKMELEYLRNPRE